MTSIIKNKYLIRLIAVVTVIVLYMVCNFLVIAQNEDAVIAAEDQQVEAVINGEIPVAQTSENIPQEEIEEKNPVEPAVGGDAPVTEEKLVVEEAPVAEPVGEAVVEEEGIEQPAEAVKEVKAEEKPVEAKQETIVKEEKPVEEVIPEEKGTEVVKEEIVEEQKVTEEIPVEEKVAETVVEEEPVETAVKEVEEVIPEEKIQEVPEEVVAESEQKAGTEEEKPAEATVAEEKPVVEEAPLEQPVETVVDENLTEQPVEETAKEEIVVTEGTQVEEGAMAEQSTVMEEQPANLDEVVNKAMEDALGTKIEQPPENIGKLSESEMKSSKVLEDQEVLRRKAFEQHGIDSYKNGKNAMANRDYAKAAQLFQEAMRYTGRRIETRDVFLNAKRNLSECYYQQALLKKSENQYDAAVDFAKSALVHGHPKAAKLIEDIKIEREQKAKPLPLPPQVTTRRKDRDYQEMKQDIETRLLKGRQFYQTGEYEKAKAKFEEVLKRDPSNTEAIRMMEKIGRILYDRSTMELEATRKNMISDVRDTWNPRNYAVEEEQLPVDQIRGKKPGVDTERIKIEKKMEAIKIPEIDFRQANIFDVVTFLSQSSADFDNVSKEDEEKGVNIILNLGTGKGQPATASRTGEAAVPFGEAGEFEGAAQVQPTDIPLITFNARYISLLETLKIVTDIANLKYRIQGNIVMIIPKNAPEGEILHRMYDVQSSFGQRVKEFTEQLAGGSAGGGGGGGFIERGGGGCLLYTSPSPRDS